jgi:hypothetical protein
LCRAGGRVGGCVGYRRGDCVYAGSFRDDRLGGRYRFEFGGFVVVGQRLRGWLLGRDVWFDGGCVGWGIEFWS